MRRLFFRALFMVARMRNVCLRILVRLGMTCRHQHGYHQTIVVDDCQIASISDMNRALGAVPKYCIICRAIIL